MKRALAGAYFAAVCLHAALWLTTLVWPSAAIGASADVAEMLGILVVLASPLMLVAALLGLVEPRKRVAGITAFIVLSLCVEVFRAVSTFHAATHARYLEGAIAAVILLLAVAGLIVVADGRRRPSAARDDAGDRNDG